jgi:hypothetical protein
VAYVPNENDELTEEQQRLHARLIAAAGTAAQEAKEMGYDPVAAVKALPELLFHAKQLLESLNQHGPYNPKREEGRVSLQGALASAEGSENEQ